MVSAWANGRKILKINFDWGPITYPKRVRSRSSPWSCRSPARPRATYRQRSTGRTLDRSSADRRRASAAEWSGAIIAYIRFLSKAVSQAALRRVGGIAARNPRLTALRADFTLLRAVSGRAAARCYYDDSRPVRKPSERQIASRLINLAGRELRSASLGALGRIAHHSTPAAIELSEQAIMFSQ